MKNNLTLFLSAVISINCQAQLTFSENKLDGTTFETYGVSVGDINNDNCADLFFNNHRFAPTTYINNCNGTFTESPQLLVSPNITADTHGAAFGDFDNDNDQDLYLTTGGGDPNTLDHQNEFYINTNGVLTNQADTYGLLFGQNRGRQSIWMDVNSDGLLDLGILGQTGSTADSVSSIFVQNLNPTMLDQSFTNKTGDLAFDCDGVPGGFPRYGLLTDLGGSTGLNGEPKLDLVCGEYDINKVYDLTQNPLADLNVFKDKARKTSDAVAGDFNGDGFNDIFAVPLAIRSSHGLILPDTNNREFAVSLKHNISLENSTTAAMAVRIYTQGSLNLSVEAPNLSNKQYSIWIGSNNNGQGIHPSPPIIRRAPSNTTFNLPDAPLTLDPNNTDNQGIRPFDINASVDAFHIGYIEDVNNPNNSYWKIITSDVGFAHTIFTGISTADVNQIEIYDIEKVTANEVLHDQETHKQEPNLFIFDDVTNQLVENRDLLKENNQVEKITGISVVSGDFDNDMDLDVIVACQELPETCDHYLYTNDGAGQFTMTRLENLSQYIAESLATADFNNDGKLDLAFANGWFTATFNGLGGSNTINAHALHLNTLINNNNSIEFDLEGNGFTSNKDGIGATVIITTKENTPDEKSQQREQNNGVHRSAQNQQRLHFGLGSNSIVDSVEVIWDDGTVEVFSDVDANRLYKITQGSGQLTTLVDYDGNSSTGLTLSISDVTIDEDAGNAVFEFTLSQAPGSTVVSFDFATADGSAIHGNDYTPRSGSRTMTGTQTTKYVAVAITDDLIAEETESFTMNLHNVVGATVDQSTGTATINDNEPGLTLSINDVTVDEDAVNAVFEFTLSQAPGSTLVEFDFATADGSAVQGSDYTERSEYRSMTGTQTIRYVAVAITDDLVAEGSEFFTMNLLNVVGATVAKSTGTATINDNEPGITLSINDVTVDEGAGFAVFEFTLSQAPGSILVEFDFATADGSAVQGSDYTERSEYRSMTGTQTTKYVAVAITDDFVVEDSESFTMNLHNVVGATVAQTTGTATINDND